MPNSHYTGPLGATIQPSGIQFAVHAMVSTGIDLLLFSDAEAQEPQEIVSLDPILNKTGDVWHIFITGVGHGQVYNWRLRNRNRVRALVDPYGVAVGGWKNYDRNAAQHFDDNTSCALRSVAVDLGLYDIEEAVDRVAAAVEAIKESGIAIVLTARADCFLTRHENPLSESIKRLNRYRQAGAHCLYAPGPTDAETIATLVKEVEGPVNVVAGLSSSALSVEKLSNLGVRRISTGGALMRTSLAALR